MSAAVAGRSLDRITERCQRREKEMKREQVFVFCFFGPDLKTPSFSLPPTFLMRKRFFFFEERERERESQDDVLVVAAVLVAFFGALASRCGPERRDPFSFLYTPTSLYFLLTVDVVIHKVLFLLRHVHCVCVYIYI